MNKAQYIEEIYNDLKDNIEFDEDVRALFRVLKVFLERNIEEGLAKGFYLFKHYDLKLLAGDIDLNPLTVDFMLELLKYYQVKDLFLKLSELPQDNKKYIMSVFFNGFRDHGCYEYLKRIVMEENYRLELRELMVILSFDLDRAIFDETYFLKKIILMHIENDKTDLPILFNIIELAKSKKAKAILKSLIIDYI